MAAAGQQPDGPPLTVLLVDDNAWMRQVLRLVLEAEHRWEIVGEATDGEEGIAAAGRLQPSVIVLDQQMPRLTGLESLPRLRLACPFASIVMWSSDPSVRASALDRGADAFLDKADSLEALTHAMRLHVGRR